MIRLEKRRYVDALGLFFVDSFIEAAYWVWVGDGYEEMYL